MMLWAVAQEDTRCGTLIHFVRVIWVRKTLTTENAKEVEVWRAMKEVFKWRDRRRCSRGHSIDEVDGSVKGKMPKTIGDRGLCHESETGLYNVAVTPFNYAILFTCMRAGELMDNAQRGKVG